VNVPDSYGVRSGFSQLTPEAESSLLASDAIIEISADAIISIDAHQRIIRFNRGAEEIFGYRAAELLGRPIDLLLPERFRSGHAAHIARFGAGTEAARRMGERRQIAGLRASGEEFPAEASISKLDLAGARIYTVVLRDISERQRVEQGQRLLAQAGELLAGTLDARRALEVVAQAALPLLGDGCIIFLREDSDVPRRALTAHCEPGRAEAMRRLRDIPVQLRTGHPVTLALTAGRSNLVTDIDDARLHELADDAEHLQILRLLDPRSMIAVPMNPRGAVMGALCFFADGQRHRVHDLEDLALAEQLARLAGLALDNARLFAEAQSAVSARDDVLAVVSHDLGNPLSAIRVSTSLLLRQPPAQRTEELDRRQLENIRASIEQMERLIRDLLDVKRIEAGLLSLEQERCPVAALVREVAEAANSWITGRTLRLELHPGIDDLHVFADAQRILQIFSNLIGNAARFAPVGSAIELHARRSDSHVQFSIIDTGPGIPAEHLPHIFDRFWQARRTGRHGMGLGLAIVKGLVEAQNGRVWAESELGVGSQFHFTLPLLPPPGVS
jgi:PAS domain S-box-containing protein